MEVVKPFAKKWFFGKGGGKLAAASKVYDAVQDHQNPHT